MIPHVAPADESWVSSLPGWLGIAFTYAGLKALGVPRASLDSFPVEFKQGMAARAAILHDAPDGARIFRERLPQIQAFAAYWERRRVGTLHDFRVALIDNDTRILFTIVYDDDFKPYIEDTIREAGPWLDQIFLGVWDGFRGSKDRKSVEELLGFAFECDLFYVSNPGVAVRDVTKMQRLSKAVGERLDAAS